MKNILLFAWVFIFVCFSLKAMDQTHDQESFDIIINKYISQLPRDLIEDQEQLTHIFFDELRSWDPHDSFLLEKIVPISQDPLTMRAIASLVLPHFFQMACSYYGLNGLQFGHLIFSMQECSSMALNMILAWSALFEISCRVEHPVNDRMRRRYCFFSSMGHFGTYALTYMIRLAEHFSRKFGPLPATLELGFSALPPNAVALSQIYALADEVYMDNRKWLETVLEILSIKYSIIGDINNLKLIEHLLTYHRHQ